ncbi:serine O-acetyltransferase [Rhizobium binxianense]
MHGSTKPETWFSDQMLWSRILAEANDALRQEPILAPVIHELVRERTSLRDALCKRITQLLLPPISSPALMNSSLYRLLTEDASIFECASLDLAAVLDRDPATSKALHVLLHAKGFLAIQAHRFAHVLWHRNRRELARYVHGCVSRQLQVDIHPAARLGSGIFFDHATGIVIGETCVIEDNVSILQNVTLGGTGKESGDRHPKIRRGVLIGAGATILGNIEIGANARVGAGSVVLKQVEPGSTVAGVPAQALRHEPDVEPSRTMDQVFEDVEPRYDVGL